MKFMLRDFMIPVLFYSLAHLCNWIAYFDSFLGPNRCWHIDHSVRKQVIPLYVSPVYFSLGFNVEVLSSK